MPASSVGPIPFRYAASLRSWPARFSRGPARPYLRRRPLSRHIRRATCAHLPLTLEAMLLAFLLAVTLPFAQSWTDTALIAADDDWSGVPGVVGYRGDGLAAEAGADPQAIV